MKAIIITQDFYPVTGGIANYLDNFIKKYLFEFEVHIIIPTYLGDISIWKNKNYKVHQVEFYPFELNTKNRISTNKKIIFKLEEIKPEIIFVGYLRSHPEAVIEYAKSNKTITSLIAHAKEIFLNEVIINNINGSHKGYLKEEINFYKNILNNLNYIFPVSNYTKQILEKLKIKTKKIVINPSILIPQIRQIKILNNDKINILSVGRLVKRKGQEKIIKTIKKFDNVIYDIVGDGPEKNNIKKIIKELNMEKTVLLHMNVSDEELCSFYEKADIFVLLTDQLETIDVEGFGIVFLEAGAHKIPVIAGNTGGVSDAVIDGTTGFLIKPEENYLKEKLELLINNSKLREEMGINSYFNAKSHDVSIKSRLILDLIMNNK